MTKEIATPGDAPAGATGKAAEYLEKLVGDSFKRELDQEENVVRSLPFFATSIGVLITFIGFARGALPAFVWTGWPILVYGLLTGLLTSLIALLVFLYQAVCQRKFNYPMQEAELIEYAANLTAYYREVAASEPANQEDEEGDPVEIVERAVIDDIRNTMLEQTSTAARLSRSNNWARLKARARAFSALMAALAFALALIVAILIHDALNGGPRGKDVNARPGTTESHDAGHEDRPARGEAKGSGDAGSGQGGVALRGVPAQGQGAEQREQDKVSGQTSQTSGCGSAATGSQPAAATGASGAATAPVKPSAPPMVPCQKSLDGGGKLTR